MIEITPEERKQAYITLVHEEYKPVKYKWWKSTGRIHYHFTKDLARENYKRIDRVGPVEFRKGKFGAYITAGVLIPSIFGTFFIDRVIGFFAFLVLLIFFGLALPRLLDKKVRIRIIARDVLHSFFLPHFRVKMDAVPGLPTYFVFTPEKTTEEKC